MGPRRKATIMLQLVKFPCMKDKPTYVEPLITVLAAARGFLTMASVT